MRILGIDPGLQTTGYGFIDCTSTIGSSKGEDLFNHQIIRLLEAGIIQPKRREPIQNRLKTIYQVLYNLVERYKPDVFVLEKLYAHYKHPITASILGHVRGVICLLSAQKNIQLAEHSVKRIRKNLTGNGSATKLQTLRIVANVLHIDENQLTLDASDALALALGYIYLNEKRVLFGRIPVCNLNGV